MMWARFRHLFILGFVVSVSIRLGDLLLQAFWVLDAQDVNWLAGWVFTFIVLSFTALVFAYFIKVAYDSIMFLIHYEARQDNKLGYTRMLDRYGELLGKPRNVKRFKILWWTVTLKESDEKYGKRLLGILKRNPNYEKE